MGSDVKMGDIFENYQDVISKKISESFDVDVKYVLKVFRNDLDNSSVIHGEESYIFTLGGAIKKYPKLSDPKMINFEIGDDNPFRIHVSSSYNGETGYVIWNILIFSVYFYGSWE